uniref:uncharacterized protein LOC113176289 n=1 Tax=Urocitellus parryii TaxID=9999 RepID=UPI000E56067B|nr:uncharacterized protein LOC113176289 [Urocitellus parryii]XP_026236538.1 uncharacterized protein LOC113176289 [Urocitellus parryii]
MQGRQGTQIKVKGTQTLVGACLEQGSCSNWLRRTLSLGGRQQHVARACWVAQGGGHGKACLSPIPLSLEERVAMFGTHFSLRSRRTQWGQYSRRQDSRPPRDRGQPQVDTGLCPLAAGTLHPSRHLGSAALGTEQKTMWLRGLLPHTPRGLQASPSAASYRGQQVAGCAGCREPWCAPASAQSGGAWLQAACSLPAHRHPVKAPDWLPQAHGARLRETPVCPRHVPALELARILTFPPWDRHVLGTGPLRGHRDPDEHGHPRCTAQSSEREGALQSLQDLQPQCPELGPHWASSGTGPDPRHPNQNHSFGASLAVQGQRSVAPEGSSRVDLGLSGRPGSPQGPELNPSSSQDSATPG